MSHEVWVTQYSGWLSWSIWILTFRLLILSDIKLFEYRNQRKCSKLSIVKFQVFQIARLTTRVHCIVMLWPVFVDVIQHRYTPASLKHGWYSNASLIQELMIWSIWLYARHRKAKTGKIVSDMTESVVMLGSPNAVQLSLELVGQCCMYAFLVALFGQAV